MIQVAPPHQHTDKHAQHTYHTHTERSMVATIASYELSPDHNMLEMMPKLVSHKVYGN